MSLVVLGCSGWIGSRLVHQVGGICKSPLSSTTSPNDLKQWLNLQMADTYINCIGKTSGSETEMEWSNVGVVELLLDVATRTGARIINLGSASEYGDAQVQEIDENFEPNPISIYGKQKLVANQMINDFVSKGGSGVATRIFNVLGRGQSRNTAIGQIIEKIRAMDTGGKIEVENHDVVRDYVSIDFVVNVLAVLTANSFSGTLNIGSGKPVVFLDLLHEIGLLHDTMVEPGILYEDRIRSVVASTKILKSLGLKEESYSLQELAKMVTSN